MDQLNNHEYYVARAESAREMAQRAVNPAIAAIHTQMATRYEITSAQGEGNSLLIVGDC